MAGAPFDNLGGYRPSVIAQFPALAGWREQTSGIVVPPRQTIASFNGLLTAALNSTSFFNLALGASGNPGSFNSGSGGTAPPLETLQDGDALLIESCGLVLASASIANALTVIAAQLVLLRPPGTHALAILPFAPPTLNTISAAGSIAYTLSGSYVVGARELTVLGQQAGQGTSLPISDLQLSWGITITNSNAAAVTFSATLSLAYRRFSGISPS